MILIFVLFILLLYILQFISAVFYFDLDLVFAALNFHLRVHASTFDFRYYGAVSSTHFLNAARTDTRGFYIFVNSLSARQYTFSTTSLSWIWLDITLKCFVSCFVYCSLVTTVELKGKLENYYTLIIFIHTYSGADFWYH